MSEEIERINRRIHTLAVGEQRQAVWGVAISSAGVALTIAGYCIDNGWLGAAMF